MPARIIFPFLKLDIISRDNIGKECLDFIDRKESSGTVVITKQQLVKSEDMNSE